MTKFVSWITDNDSKLFHYVNQYLKCSFLDLVMPRITHLGGASFCLALLLLLIFSTPDPYRLWTYQALLSLILSHLLVQFIKRIIPRLRPYIRFPEAHTLPNPLTDYSFPSGHTTAIFSICVLYSLYVPFLAFFLLPLACLVGLSRMYLGLHYPTDCLMGAFLGSFTSIVIVIIGGM